MSSALTSTVEGLYRAHHNWLTRVRLFEGELAMEVANDPRRSRRSTTMWAPGSTACWWPRRCAWRISGSYPLDDSERILQMLEVALPVRVRRFTR
ncbi:hypothetical protein [Pseudomonas fortuita]|uniref:hypothetical protein n=1 Tax=Pseudomonas fortuita TaxID=3233375 RepID=UPI003D9FC21B